MNRIKGILTAGTLTGLVLITALVFGFSKSNGNGVTETAVPSGIIINPIVVPSEIDTQTAVSGDANYTQQLEGTLQLMQSREAEYQTQIEAANQTILQLQDQVNLLAAPVSASEYTEYEDDDDDYEDDDDEEYEDHEEEDDDD